MLNNLSSVANIINNMDIFIYPLIVGILLCFSAGILGVILVLKRYSMIGDGLSHVTFGVFAIALSFEFVKTSYAIVIPVVIVAAYVLLRIGESTKIKGDAAIGLISSASLAIGYLVGSQNGFTTDIDSYMFGEQLVVDGDLMISDVYINEDAANLTYRFTDIYNQQYWTEAFTE